MSSTSASRHEALRVGVAEQPFADTGPRIGPPDSLVLDIGGGVGALVLYADECCLGEEIDLSPVGSSRSHAVHTMIRRRRATGTDIIAGVYPGLLAGSYTVWGLDGAQLAAVEIEGGRVTELQIGDARSIA